MKKAKGNRTVPYCAMGKDIGGLDQDVEEGCRLDHTMQAVVGASAAPLRVPGVPVAPQGPMGQGLQGPAVTAETLEDLGWRILAQESQGVHLPQEDSGKLGVNMNGPGDVTQEVRLWERVVRALFSPTAPTHPPELSDLLTPSGSQ